MDWAIFWKLEWPASLPHSTTWAPDTGLPTRAPEITTLRPAVEGFGADAMVRLPGVHGVGQQPPGGQQVDVQQGALALTQQGVVAPTQHAVGLLAVGGQQSGWTSELLPAAGCVGTGQHGTMGALETGHTMRGARAAAPAEPAMASTQTAAAARTESGMIARRIAGRGSRQTTIGSLPIFHKPSAA